MEAKICFELVVKRLRKGTFRVYGKAKGKLSFSLKLVNGAPISKLGLVLNSSLFGFRCLVPLEWRIRIKIFIFLISHYNFSY